MATTAEDARRNASAARRRSAVQVLRVAAGAADHAARVAANGASPSQAREAILDAAGELASAWSRLRHLARLDRPDRVRLAKLWTGNGVSVVEVARRLGCSERQVHRWLGHP